MWRSLVSSVGSEKVGWKLKEHTDLNIEFSTTSSLKNEHYSKEIYTYIVLPHFSEKKHPNPFRDSHNMVLPQTFP